MEALDPNVVASTAGYLVTDARGRLVGRVERASRPPEGGGVRLVVRGRLPLRRRRMVPIAAIEEVDQMTRVVLLSVMRESLPEDA